MSGEFLGWAARYWLGVLFGAAAGALGVGFRRLCRRRKAREEHRQALEAAVQALLHDRIYGEYAACFRKGWADVDDRKNIECLYRPYHAMGGNGTGTDLFRRIQQMPGAPAERSSVCGRQH